MSDFVQDVRYAARVLLKSPAFTLVAVLSLALGIGANTTIFSLVNAVFLRPLPVERPQEIAAVYTADYSGPLYGASSYPDYEDFRGAEGAFSGLVAYTMSAVSLGVEGSTERAFAEVVSANYFEVLGVRPAMGRGFLPAEDSDPGTHAVTVLSHGLWQRRFGADPSILGKAILLNGHPFTVVGVGPAQYMGLTRGPVIDLWVPAMMMGTLQPASNSVTSRGSRGWLLMGRLRAGVTVPQAQSRLDAVAARLHESHKDQWTNLQGQRRPVTVVAESAARVFPAVRGPILGFLGLLMAVVALVLLLACANLAHLLLARATARRKEIGIRLSLGAGRLRLLRQLLTESLLLGLLGGAAGLLVALWGTELLMAFKPPLPVPVYLDLGLDLRVLGFTLALSLLTGLGFGLAPALAATRPDVVPALKDGAGAASGRRSRLRGTLVVGQVAVSLLLLIGAGLFVRSLSNARAVDLGFDPAGLVTVSVDLGLGGYDAAKGREFYERAVERLKTLPGVQAASVARTLPLALSQSRRGVRIEGYVPRTGEDMEVRFTAVGPGYFETLRMPILRGRGIAAQDREGAPLIAVVNEAFVRRYWPGQEPLGRQLRFSGPNGPPAEVVGVARDGKYATLGEDQTPFLYASLMQSYASSASLVVRTDGPAPARLDQVRSELRALDRNLPIFDAKSFEEHLGLALLPARLAGGVLGSFGAVALLLAGLGLYGVMSYSVSQRSREVGIRMALGARAEDVLRLVVGEGMRLAALGMALGLLAALGVGRLLASFLYGLSPTDPFTFAGVAAVLASVAFLACWVPARRATRVDPVVALRYE